MRWVGERLRRESREEAGVEMGRMGEEVEWQGGGGGVWREGISSRLYPS